MNGHGQEGGTAAAPGGWPASRRHGGGSRPGRLVIPVRHAAAKAAFPAILVIVTCLAYAGSLDGEFIFDDSIFYNSPYVRLDTLSLDRLADVVTRMQPGNRPVANLTLALNYFVHGFEVRGYHLVNLAIHLAAGLVLYLFIKTTLSLPVLRNRYGAAADRLAFAAALLWMVHPLQTQAVSYVVQRMTSLAALFYVGAMLLYVLGRTAAGPDRRFLCLAGAVLAAMLALGSKEIAVTLPVFILLYEWFFFRDLRLDWLAGHKHWVAGAALAVLLIALYFLGTEPLARITAGYDLRPFTMSERVLTEFRVLFFYVSLLLFPHPSRLSLEHDFPVSTSLLEPWTTLPAILAFAAALALAAFIARRHRLAAFGILWFLGNHLLEGSILSLELVFEHRNYLPSMMPVLLMVIAVHRAVSSPAARIGVLCLTAALFAYWTWQRNFVWQDRITFWSDCMHKAPNAARPHNNLAVALRRKGLLDEAIFHYKETIRLDPGFVEAYYNLGNTMMLAGRKNEALTYYRHAVRLNPGHPQLRLGLANALFDTYRLPEAKKEYLEVLRLDPGNVAARGNLENVNRLLGFQIRNAK